jgi:hypothetical protein
VLLLDTSTLKHPNKYKPWLKLSWKLSHKILPWQWRHGWFPRHEISALNWCSWMPEKTLLLSNDILHTIHLAFDNDSNILSCSTYFPTAFKRICFIFMALIFSPKQINTDNSHSSKGNFINIRALYDPATDCDVNYTFVNTQALWDLPMDRDISYNWTFWQYLRCLSDVLFSPLPLRSSSAVQLLRRCTSQSARLRSHSLELPACYISQCAYRWLVCCKG